MMKRCTKCHELKDFDQFYKDSSSSSGLNHQCNECCRAKRRAFYRKNLTLDKKETLDLEIARKKELAELPRPMIKMMRRQAARMRARKHREALDPVKKFQINFSNSLNRGLKTERIQNWEQILGYTFNDLKIHIENLFKPGMSWSNYGRKLKNSDASWVIDHIIPVSAFKYQSYLDHNYKKCWGINNLQPLWIVENHIKGSKYNAIVTVISES